MKPIFTQPPTARREGSYQTNSHNPLPGPVVTQTFDVSVGCGVGCGRRRPLPAML
jgi:hypothetical protein